MQHFFSALALGLLLGACASTPDPSPAPAPAPPADPDALVPFTAPESAQRLARSRHAVDFFPLANHFEGQIHAGMCGPATAVVVLNTLRAHAPEALPVDRSTIPERYHDKIPPRFDPFFKRYTQRAFFADPRVSAVKTEDAFYGAPAGPDAQPDPGMQLGQLHGIFTALGLASELRVLDESLDDAAARAEILANLARPGDYVVVNYLRVPLGQEGGGHISPLGAYDEVSDSFLVLDVNPNRGKTWAWVPATRLLAAMRTRDRAHNRGYLLVREGAPAF